MLNVNSPAFRLSEAVSFCHWGEDWIAPLPAMTRLCTSYISRDEWRMVYDRCAALMHGAAIPAIRALAAEFLAHDDALRTVATRGYHVQPSGRGANFSMVEFDDIERSDWRALYNSDPCAMRNGREDVRQLAAEFKAEDDTKAASAAIDMLIGSLK